MIISNYTQSKGNKLKRISISEIDEPEWIKVLWIQAMTFEDNRKKIGSKSHRHSFFEIHFTLSGQITYECEKGNIYTMDEGQFVLFSPKSQHTVTEYANKPVRLSVTFVADENGYLYNELSNKEFYRGSMTKNMISDIEEILKETEHRDFFSQTAIKNHILNLICEISRSVGLNEARKTAERGSDMRVDMIKQYINDNKNILLTCKDVAEQCHFNVKYINRVFKNKTGETLLEYIHKVKIKDAEKLLDNEKLSLEKISRQLGFANEYYFNSFFKRYTGIAPGQYRKLKIK